MPIRFKLLAAFLTVSLAALGISYGINLFLQNKAISVFEQIGGQLLPGSMAISQLSSEFYRIEFLLDDYEQTPSREQRAKIEAAMASLSSYQAEHSMFHAGDDMVEAVEEYCQRYARLVTRYLLLSADPKLAAERQEAAQKIHQLVKDFNDRVAPHIKEDITHSYQRIAEVTLVGPRSRQWLAVSSVLLIVFTVLVSMYISRRLSKPLGDLRDATLKVGSGQYDFRFEFSSRDEIGDLALHFNRMIERLAGLHHDLSRSNERLQGSIVEKTELVDELVEYRQRLELLVEERTAELAAAKEAAESEILDNVQFLAYMSHELRRPINGIIGMTHLVLQTQLDRRQRDFVDKAHSSAHSLLGILNDILDFSKIEAGKMDIEETRFRLCDVLDNVRHIISLKCQEKSISLECEQDESVPTALVGDPLRISQVLINLAGNAVKFTPEQGAISVKIDLREESDEDALLHFQVRDSGIGMSEEQMSKLFVPFVQADASTTRRFGGTGLGLSICKHLTRLMQGNIWVESVLGKGSTFHVSLRLKKQIGVPSEPAALSLAARLDASDAIERLQGAKVLVVEDNRINQELAFELLSSNGLLV